MDTPQGESAASLSVSDAAALFERPQPEPEAQATDKAPAEGSQEPTEATQAQAEPEKVDEPSDADETVTIQVDGKPVEIKKSELADHYKNGLRQADYTRKTMEAAEQRKAAEAESRKAGEERQQAMSALSQAHAVLQAQLHEQSQIDWNTLLETDPQEYLKQKHLAEARQAKLHHVIQQQQQLHQQHQADQAKAQESHLLQQRDELLAKLPEWKDEAKAKIEKAQLTEYLIAQGFDEKSLSGITDHRAVILSRKAMLYDKMISDAKAAAKKVANLPTKTARPGGGETNPLDGRTAAMQQLRKSGSVRDAAAVFALLK